MSSKNQKQHIREKLLAKRQKMQEPVYLNNSECICNSVKELELFKKAKTVHCYVSMNERCEVNTHPLIKEMLAGSKKVVVPVMEKKGRLKHIQLVRFDDLQPNQWQVPEPVRGKEINTAQLDIILVPMVGGDLHKNRIGYGGGFYDCFLRQLSCPHIGLLFERCLVENIPIDSYDVPLTKIVTEKQIIL